MAFIQFQLRRGTAAEWTNANPILALGEMGIETDTNQFKIGNGVTTWNLLSYGGIQGETGFTGSVGFTGSQGVIGFSGSQGNVGFTGSRGDTGFTGSQGVIGFTGSQGTVGFTGSRGTDGVIGVDGFTGSQGAVGFTGSQGDIGFTGSVGFTGSQGTVGFTGSQGDVGFTGSRGTDGVIGVDGFTGSQGATGFTGSVGFTGSQGDVGFTGSLGFTGSQGIPGISDISLDTTPQLGGDLDVNGFAITATPNNDVSIVTTGAGALTIDGEVDHTNGTMLTTSFVCNVAPGSTFEVISSELQFDFDTLTFDGELTVNGDITLTSANTINVNGSMAISNTLTVSGGSVLTVNNVFTALIGDNSNTVYTVTHDLDATSIFTEVREVASGALVYPDIDYTSANAISVAFSVVPTTDQYRVSVFGV